MIEGVAYGNTQSPAGSQHPHHFPQRRVPVFEKHQAELADHHVEIFIGEWQRLGAPRLPHDLLVAVPRNGKHAAVRIETNDGSAPAGAPCGGTGKHASAAGNIEHALTRGDTSRIRDHISPVREQRGDELPFVYLGGRKVFLRVHGIFSGELDASLAHRVAVN
jgi:hypothetical protein